jgi:D-arabinose 1-dehydrogenase-like Zn-dependent alcohol dehydrogenase
MPSARMLRIVPWVSGLVLGSVVDGTTPAFHCLRGDFVNCANAVLTGIMIDGGYAEVMIIEARATVAIPDGLEAVKGAPPMCRCDDI